MNTSRQRFIDTVKNGSDRPFVSVQIGAGAGFDAKLAGKEWISETSLEDTVSAYERVECDALINIGTGDFCDMIPGLAWETKVEHKGEQRVVTRHLETPHGPLHWKFEERKCCGTTPLEYPVKFGDGLDKVFWFAQQQLKALAYLPEHLGPLVEKLHPQYAISYQWPLQPFECLGLATVPDMVMFAMSDAERYRQLCDLILEVNTALSRAVIACGVDFLFLGGPGREMMSPALYETYMVPDSQVISRAIHEAGGLVYSHICSPVQPFLDMGYYGQMGIDLFETLSPPPVGNVESLQKAREVLPAQMCTRGNLGLDVLLHATPQQVAEKTRQIMEQTRGTKHMVAASDYLFYDIPFENIRAMVKTVKGETV